MSSQPIRHCSFCRGAGHIISNCNSIELTTFENKCSVYIYVLIFERLDIMSMFRIFILNEAAANPALVKAFAIKNCGSTLSHNMDNIITNIINHYTPLINTAIDMFESTFQVNANNPPHEFQRSEIYMGALLLSNMLNMPQENTKFNIHTTISEKLHEFKQYECGICYENKFEKQFVKLDCGHEFCKDCIKKSLQNELKRTCCCAFCRSEIKNFILYDRNIQEEFADLISSTPI
jgi:hypothetical protein